MIGARAQLLRNLALCSACLLFARCTGADTSGLPPRSASGSGGSGSRPVTPPQAGHAAVSGAGGAAASSGTGGQHAEGLPAPNISAIFKNGCATSTVESELLPSNMLFVIDRSASMACNPPPTTASNACEVAPMTADPTMPTKWEITRGALESAIAALPAETSVGLSYFSNDDACGVYSMPNVPLAPLDAAQRGAVKTSLDNVEPGGATPLVGATILAYQHLHSLALSGAIHGRQFVVLLTDGQQSDNCSDPMECSGQEACTNLLVNQEVPKAAGPGVGIKTFVIGAPGSEPARVVLSEIASKGGTAPPGCDPSTGTCHFDMTMQANFDQALADALTKIAGQTALSCELPVPNPSGVTVDTKYLNVVYSPADGSAPSLIVQTKGSCDSAADGWQYSEGNTKIELCGKSCDEVRKNRGARVDVVLGCPIQGPG